MIEKIPPKGVSVSDFISTFAMSINPEPLGFAASRVEELFVAQDIKICLML